MGIIKSQTFINWFNLFLSEKNIPYTLFEIEIDEQTHFIDNNYIIDLIKKASPKEQAIIKKNIVCLDFKNADINDYLKHLAKAYLLENV